MATPAFLRVPSHSAVWLKRRRAYTPSADGLHPGSPTRRNTAQARLRVRRTSAIRRPPAAESPFACPSVLPVAGWRPAPPRRALPLLRRSYGLMRQTKTLPPPSALASAGGSLQVAVGPCWVLALPDVISACLSLDAWTSTPVAREVHIPIASLTTTTFPAWTAGRLSHNSSLSEFRAMAHFGAAVIS